MQRTSASVAENRWDQRLDPGVDVRSISLETRGTLAQSLGILGVEAEYVLTLLQPFTAADAARAPATRAAAEHFLWQLDAWARRLISAAENLEVATQAYLASLENAHPELRGAAGDEEQPWWPDFHATPLASGSLEMGLRRCGFAFRHVVSAHLADHTQAIGEQMALVLHALNALPPAGVLPVSSLHAGLYELAEVVQGDVVLRHLRDISAEHPGLMMGIARLRTLDASEDRSLDADLAWARAQLAELERLGANLPGDSAKPPASAPPRRGLATLFRRGPATPSSALPSTGPTAFLAQARRDWGETIAALEALRTPTRGPSAGARR